MSAAPPCPRCGSDQTVSQPDNDIPDANPQYGCDECLYLWDEDSGGTSREGVFEAFAQADAVRWLNTVYPVVDAGDHVSDVEGRHLELEADDRDENIALHERLVVEWVSDEGRPFDTIAEVQTD